MSSLEALLALMMLLAAVAVVMQLHSDAREAVNFESAEQRLNKTSSAEAEQPAIALGDGRSNSSYRRWFFAP